MYARIRNPQQPLDAPNMTPFIDVLLVLIIIFMVLTPLTPKGLNAALPEAQSGNHSDAAVFNTAVVSVHRNGELELNKETVAIGELRQRLERAFQRAAKPTLFVHGDADLEFRDVARVIDIAHGAGIFRVALLTAK